MNPLALRKPRSATACAAVLFAAAVAYGIFGSNAALGDILIHTLIWTGIAISWNLTAGYAGRLSLGHAAYFGIGAYASSILYLKFGISPWIGALVGMAAAAMVGALIEVATTRLLGIYYSLATFAIAELLALLARGWTDVTAGTTGLTLPFTPGLVQMTFTGKTGYVWVALGFAGLCLAVAAGIVHSRYGFYLRAHRDDATAARALGVPAGAVCICAGVVSAALTALGGTVYAQYLLYIDPDVGFNWYISVQAALLCLIGGVGTLSGPLLGATLLVPLERVLHSLFGSEYGGLAPAIYGVLLMIVVLAMPKGIVSLLSGRAAPRRVAVPAAPPSPRSTAP